MFSQAEKSLDYVSNGEAGLPPAVRREAERSRVSRGIRTGLCCLGVAAVMAVMLPMLPDGHERVAAPAAMDVTGSPSTPAEYNNLLPREDSFVRGGMPLNRHRN